jgi:phage shock protein PspC (stress-responsive transcriptional regulator)
MNEQRTLTRSRYDKILGGVAGGLAKYLEMDSAIVRFLFILITLVFGTGFWVYIILWIILPYEPIKPYWNATSGFAPNPPEDEVVRDETQPISQPVSKMRKDSNIIIGSILIFLGVIFLVNELIPELDFGKLWPLVLIIVGGVLLYNYYSSARTGNGNNSNNSEI